MPVVIEHQANSAIGALVAFLSAHQQRSEQLRQQQLAEWDRARLAETTRGTQDRAAGLPGPGRMVPYGGVQPAAPNERYATERYVADREADSRAAVARAGLLGRQSEVHGNLIDAATRSNAAATTVKRPPIGNSSNRSTASRSSAKPTLRASNKPK